MVTKKTKAKEWYSIIAPKIFGEKEVGKTMTADSENLMNRKIILNMIELVENSDKFFMKVSLKVKRIEDKNAFTEFDGTEYMRDYISRMILRRIRRVDVIEDLKTKDGFGLRVKALVIISRRVKSTIQTSIRSDVKELIKKEVESSTLGEFIEGIISDEIKHKILGQIRKIYPVRNLEIRKTQLLS